jgi:hypothetical protein
MDTGRERLTAPLKGHIKGLSLDEISNEGFDGENISSGKLAELTLYPFSRGHVLAHGPFRP